MQAVAHARYGRIGVTVALLAGLLAIAVGGGYSASTTLLADGAAYAVDGVGLDRLNAATGAPDAEILDLAKGPNRIRVVHRDNQVYLVDTVLASVTRLDPATLELGATAKGPAAPDGGSVEVVTGGGTTALADLTKGVLQRVDQVSLAAIGSPVKVPGGLTGAVADSTGVLWVASASSGLLLRVDKAGKHTPIPVSPEGASLTVTLVGDAPVAIDIVEGRITGVDPGTLRRSRTATLPKPPTEALLVSGADTPLPNLWALDVAAHGLYRVDLAEGTVDGPVTIGAGQVTWGPPVVQAGRVYVPNLGEHRVAVVDATSLRRTDELTVPGTGPDFDVSVEGGVLWANDPTNGKALVVDAEGQSRQVGKGEGRGRLDPAPVPDPGDHAGTPAAGGPVQPPLDLTLRPPESAPVRPPASAPVPVVEPVPAPPADSLVPDLRGQEQAAACAALERVKLACQAVDTDGGLLGKVSKQEPAPGRTLPPGGTVTLAVGRGVDVPDVAGSMRDAACTRLRDVKLVCVPQAVTLERGKTRHQVFTQDPAPGQRADEGAAVVIGYWGDPRVLDVPDVTGKTPKDACDALIAAGFTCTEVAGTGRPLGRVVSQAPPMGRAAEGSGVAVTVAVTTTMPDLVDVASTTVCASLSRDLGLPAANCSKAAVDAEENPRDTVKLTTPAPGQEVTLSTLVSYVRRTGLVKVPTVGGDIDGACNAIAAAGLTCNAVPDSSGNYRQVSGQNPGGGAEVTAGTVVNVTYEPSVRVPLLRLRRGASGTEADTWMLTTDQPPGGTYWNFLVFNQGFTDEGAGTGICTAYADGETLVGDRVPLIDYMNTTAPPKPHHSFTPGTAPPGTWVVNNPRTAVVAKNGPVQVYVLTRGYSHYFTSNYTEALQLMANRNFLAGPFPVFTCW